MGLIKSKVPEADQIANQLVIFARKRQYKKGSELAKKVLKEYPDDFFFTYQYAKLLGDWADDLPIKRRKKLKTDAVKILKPLTRKLSRQSVAVRFGVCLNYYYQTYAFKSMYNYGKRFEVADRKKGLYAQALGAGLLAEKKYFTKDLAQAKRWALKSVQLWKKYGLKGESYYFPFYSLALSWVILDDARQALTHLKITAKLSQREVTCAEFKVLYNLIQNEMKQ
jgi:hypothetical protein